MSANPFILSASAHGTMIVNRFDRHQAHGGWYGVGYQILERGGFDCAEANVLCECLQRLREARGAGVLALDCGANIGTFTLEMARVMTGWGRVVAYEPQERLYYALCGNLALNNVFNASAVQAVVGAATGRMGIPVLAMDRQASMGSLELRQGPRTEFVGQTVSYHEKDLAPCVVIALDDVGFTRVDLLKIDVEGMELEVLKGAQGLIEKFRPWLWIEWIKVDRGALMEWLKARGYVLAFESGLDLLVVPEGDLDLAKRSE